MFLKWTEMMWLFLPNVNDLSDFVYLGEAGNNSYHPSDQIHAVRYGNEVLVCCGRRDEHVIPATITVKGFHAKKNGKKLIDLMEEGILYNYMLDKAE